MRRIITALIALTLIFIPSAALAAGDETPAGVPFTDIEAFVDDYMKDYIGKSTPGAAVVLVKDGDILLSKGYGYADVENQIPVDAATTVFEYGSVSKLFVYTTIMRLVEQGHIDLEADIRAYLPQGFLKKLKFNKPITLLNIMSHTAGFEDYLFDLILVSSDSLPGLEEYLRDVQPEQVYEPGSISAYSNYAVALAGYIAQRITGQEFYEYLMQTMFLPLGMNNTSAHITLEDKPELLRMKAKGYYPGKSGFTPGPWSYVVPYPAGSVTGTAEDLARFAMALMPGEGEDSPLFAEQGTLAEMLSQSHPMGPGMIGFAHGFIEWENAQVRALGHGGNTAAFSAQMNIVPEERFGVIILTNVASEMSITSGLTQALIGQRDGMVPVGSGSLPQASIVAGTYVPARRMHNGFLELYGYLGQLDVQALDANTIQLQIAGQTSTLVQTSPFVFQRVEAHGDILASHFGTVYFQVEDGEVVRMSGDYLPVLGLRTRPWQFISMGLALAALLFFLITPFVLLIGKVRRRIRRGGKSRLVNRLTAVQVFCGTALIINNLVLVVRMLENNYRSFAEVRIHVLLNYPLAIIAALLTVAIAFGWKKIHTSKGQRAFSLVTVALLATLIGLLYNWQFFVLVA